MADLNLSSDPHSASEAAIWGGCRGEAGERNQEPAEDVPHHVYSSSTAHLHVLAHLPPHQIKPGTHTHQLEDDLNAISTTTNPQENTHTHTHWRSWTFRKHRRATAVWMTAHRFPDLKAYLHIHKTRRGQQKNKRYKTMKRRCEASLPALSQHSPCH